MTSQPQYFWCWLQWMTPKPLFYWCGVGYLMTSQSLSYWHGVGCQMVSQPLFYWRGVGCQMVSQPLFYWWWCGARHWGTLQLGPSTRHPSLNTADTVAAAAAGTAAGGGDAAAAAGRPGTAAALGPVASAAAAHPCGRQASWGPAFCGCFPQLACGSPPWNPCHWAAHTKFISVYDDLATELHTQKSWLSSDRHHGCRVTDIKL